jgi:cytochrome P450
MTDQGCPVADGAELFFGEGLRDPFPILARLQAEGPVFYVPEIDHYLVTRYADIEQILLDRDTFSASIASSPVRPPSEHVQRTLDEGGFRRVPTLNNADPPRHGPMRKAVLACLSPRRIAALEPAIRDLASGFVEQLGQHTQADFVEVLSFPFPGHVAFELLGFPDGDADQLKEWSRRRVLLTYGDLSPEQQVHAAEGTLRFWRYVEDFVHSRLAQPADDLTTDLLDVHRKTPDAVAVDDVVNIVYSLALAGHETTSSLINNAVRQLLSHREQWDKLCGDPSLIPNTVEEAMRFDGPVLTHRRRAKVDTQIGGVAIPADAKVMLSFPSAHRDGRQFRDAATFDITREDAELHLGFGKGAHFCLGAPLARLEARILLETLSRELPDIDLIPGDDATFLPQMHFRSISRLPVAPRGLASAGPLRAMP